MLSPKVLRRAFYQARQQLHCRHSNGKQRRREDPVTGAMLAAEKVGWTFIDPIRIRDQHGEELHLLQGSPALLCRLYKEAWRQAQELEMESDLRNHHPELLDPGDRLCTQQARRAFNTKSKDKMTLRQKQIYMRVFAKAYPTADLFASQGLVEAACPAGCGQRDSVHHRLWMCSIYQAQRTDLLPQFQDTATAMAYKYMTGVTKQLGV